MSQNPGKFTGRSLAGDRLGGQKLSASVDKKMLEESAKYSKELPTYKGTVANPIQKFI